MGWLSPVDYFLRATTLRPNPEGVLTFEDLRRIVAAPSNLFGKNAARERDKTYFDLVDAAESAGFDATRAYLYYSPFRPLSQYVAQSVGGVALLPRWLASHEVLTPNQVVSFDLLPEGRAQARFAIDGARQLDIPLELSTDEMTEEDTGAAVLFLNPRKIWQLSYFNRVGPSGHDEHDPVEMVFSAIRSGYRWVTPGVVDALSRI